MSMLSDEYCEGWCADGGKGSWEDCTGCAIHKIESQLSAEREANARLEELATDLYEMAKHCPSDKLPPDFDFITPLEQVEGIKAALEGKQDG